MRILYLSQYFPPEAGATQNRAYEMARSLVQLGHHVTMIAEVPNHPSGIIPPEYRGLLFRRENLDGIEVLRVWVKASPEKNFRNRMLFYLSYMLTAGLAGIFLARGKYDFLYTSSPPLLAGGAALAIRTVRRIPLIFEVRDPWPESAVALGELRSPRAIRAAERLERSCYNSAAKIVLVSTGDYDKLVARGVPPGKLVVLPNGSNTDLYRFLPEQRSKIREALGLGDRFTAIYAGNFGLAYHLESVIEAARLLQSMENRVQILMLGDGPRRAEINALVEAQRLSNLILLPEQPYEAVPAYLSAADAALVPFRDNPVFRTTRPVKMYDAWACGLPVILTTLGEACELLEAHQAGVYVPPEDPQKLAETLLHLSKNRDLARRMGMNGRALVERQFSRQAIARELEEHLSKLMTPGR